MFAPFYLVRHQVQLDFGLESKFWMLSTWESQPKIYKVEQRVVQWSAVLDDFA